MSKQWYAVRANNFSCNDHDGPPRELVTLLAAYTHLSIENTPHIIERLRHLAKCLNELEAITLLRLQQGKHQSKRGEQGDGDEYDF